MQTQAEPTAADVSIAGRVDTNQGQGIRNVGITLVDAFGTQRSAITGPFGYYRFDGLNVGELYVLRARSKRYVFVESQRVVVPSDSVLAADFVAEP